MFLAQRAYLITQFEPFPPLPFSFSSPPVPHIPFPLSSSAVECHSLRDRTLYSCWPPFFSASVEAHIPFETLVSIHRTHSGRTTIFSQSLLPHVLTTFSASPHAYLLQERSLLHQDTRCLIITCTHAGRTITIMTRIPVANSKIHPNKVSLPLFQLSIKQRPQPSMAL